MAASINFSSTSQVQLSGLDNSVPVSGDHQPQQKGGEAMYVHQPSLMNMSSIYPLEYAVPIYGYAMPPLMIVTIVANTFVAVVLSQRHMVTPTNIVLLAMAVCDMLTLTFPAPWFFYLYTMGNHNLLLGPAPLCFAFVSMTEVIPNAFHTTSIWLTVFLASQRYIYICHPQAARKWCTLPRVCRTIGAIALAAFGHQMLRLFDCEFHDISVELDDGRQVVVCDKRNAPWVVHFFTTHIYYNAYFTFKALFVNLVPCAMLVLLNILLFRALKQAQLKKRKLLKDDTSHPMGLLSQLTLQMSNSTRIGSAKMGVQLLRTLNCSESRSKNPKKKLCRKDDSSLTTGFVSMHSMGSSSNAIVNSEGSRNPRNDSHTGITLMLIVVVTVFLATEIPNTTAVILHVLNNNCHLRISYDALNALMVVVNFFFMVSYPFNFAIYCGMSKQFRSTFRELFGTGWLRSPGEDVCRNARTASSMVAMNGGSLTAIINTQRTLETVL
ncbi:sex peptide receptor-like [Varroa destructor]|uniref:G-protein coupled receptors family 1 profile domain-containing protein n=1 Tax=Varroa destructor TaxID=109461 RepID=A0A7M7KNF3_VARDE|nr:sex peptide receptor-like [Varroa destructor]